MAATDLYYNGIAASPGRAGKNLSTFSSYKTYVATLCSRNPSLLNLQAFLADPREHRNGFRMIALDFRANLAFPILRSLADLDCLPAELSKKASEEIWAHDTNPLGEQTLQGRILIIEDLTPGVIELLGSELDIDPLFFAMHLHTAQRKGMRRQTPGEATLPSRLTSRDYINISYHRAVQHQSATVSGGRLMRDTILDRKLVLLPHTNIGLAQHSSSVIKVKPRDDFWIAVVLVDPPVGDDYWKDGEKYQESSRIHFPSQPYLGEYEDFEDPVPFSKGMSDNLDPVREGLFRDLQYYFSRSLSPGFNAADPTLQSLAYYPLRIAAAEWTKYVSVMHNCIKQYEYKSDTLPDLEQFDTNLYELQGWRRRSLYSQQKIRTVLRLLKARWARHPGDDLCLGPLIEDYEHILNSIEEAGRRLETMLPIVTSLVQIADARHSFAETANISRLTVLALVFVPLSFVSSLFSMNQSNAPGARYFWVYFAVAVPVTSLVFLVARPPQNYIAKLYHWARTKQRRRLKSSSYLSESSEVSQKSALP